ncbi:MAG: rod shape-determining protein RodA [Gammaproteobacteria bacterium]|nr:rod shape-determining protein RodA [Gammaproteobacteria bacterium]
MIERTLADRMHVDVPLLIGLVILCSMGLVILYSASGQGTDIVWRQGIRMFAAFGVLLLAAQVPPATLARWSIGVYALGILLLVVVLLFGDVGKGAQRWLDLGFVRFQPSEMMKVVVPMVLAWLISEGGVPPRFGRVCLSCILIILPVLMIAKQPDLGTALLVACAGFSVLFVAGLSLRAIMGFAVVAGAAMPVLWHFLHDYQRQRVLMFLDPQQDPLGSGYHIIQSQIAIGSGGLYGKGWLNGTQSHLEFLPERSTDFIFAVFCEEFGLMGALLLISVYAFVIGRGLYISVKSQHTFGRLFGCGIVLTFFVYIIVNMGMVSGQVPVVGIPLPLVSHGGTSLVTLLVGFGMLMAIHTHRRFLAE